MSKKLTAEEYQKKYAEFIELYNKGFSLRQLADYFNLSLTTIKDRIKMGRNLSIIGEKYQDRVKVEKSKMKLQDEKQFVQQLLKDKSRTELIIDAVKEAIIPIEYKPSEIILPKYKGTEEEQACLVISDVHVGKVTKTYNPKVFKERLEYLTKSMCRITDILRNGYKIDVLNIMLGGDIVDGEGIYPTQAYHINQGVLKQVFQVGLPEFSNQLIFLSKYFKQINIYCTRGNHSRSGKFADETSNWDTVFYEALKASTQNYKNIKWNISYEWNNRFKIYDWVFELMHGHQCRMYFHTPIYNITMKGSRWQGSHGGFDYLIMGHFHNVVMSQFNNWEFMLNGTFSSSDEYADEQLGLLGSTEQLFFGIHPRKKVTWRYKIKLDK